MSKGTCMCCGCNPCVRQNARDSESSVERMVMRVLHLTLKKKWFDMILSGEKKEEYREIKQYWDKRLNRTFDAVCFSNGYANDSPKVTVRLKYIQTGLGVVEWGAPENEKVYILRLGEIIDA
ncbi:ASCH domain-containing protein [Sulfurovum sp.]|uniref:ASCH domain-containing protein n=1 Tax=Sulfurovum sp. TaxID=1969726 RepID=UPI00356A319B